MRFKWICARRLYLVSIFSRNTIYQSWSVKEVLVPPLQSLRKGERRFPCVTASRLRRCPAPGRSVGEASRNRKKSWRFSRQLNSCLFCRERDCSDQRSEINRSHHIIAGHFPSMERPDNSDYLISVRAVQAIVYAQPPTSNPAFPQFIPYSLGISP